MCFGFQALIFASQCPEVHDPMNGMNRCDEDSAVFFLELLIKVVLQNRYVMSEWLVCWFDVLSDVLSYYRLISLKPQ